MVFILNIKGVVSHECQKREKKMAMELYFRGPFSSQGLLIGKSKDLGFFSE